MKCFESKATRCLAAGLGLLLAASPLYALKSDRQEPLDVKADATDGTLGDGLATLKGSVEIRQGTLLITADVADVAKAEGRVTRIELSGEPVHLQQEIENEGMVVAEASRIEYEVATGIVTLTGNADVAHPQYRISGEKLVYDMNVQHFQGSGNGEEGRIQIRLDPELLNENDVTLTGAPAEAGPDAEDTASGEADAAKSGGNEGDG